MPNRKFSTSHFISTTTVLLLQKDFKHFHSHNSILNYQSIKLCHTSILLFNMRISFLSVGSVLFVLRFQTTLLFCIFNLHFIFWFLFLFFLFFPFCCLLLLLCPFYGLYNTIWSRWSRWNTYWLYDTQIYTLGDIKIGLRNTTIGVSDIKLVFMIQQLGVDDIQIGLCNTTIGVRDITFRWDDTNIDLQYTNTLLVYNTQINFWFTMAQRYFVYYTLIYSLGNAWFTIHKYVLVNVTLVHFRTQKIMNHFWSLSLHNFFFVYTVFCFFSFPLLCFVAALWLLFL